MTVKIMKTSSNQFKNKIQTIEPIKVIEPFKCDVISFENPDEFNIYYRTHEDEFKDISTVLLNRKYKIPGYRITQTRGSKEDGEARQLSLKKDYYVGIQNNPGNHQQGSSAMEEQISKINALEQQVESLRIELNNVIKYLQEPA